MATIEDVRNELMLRKSRRAQEVAHTAQRAEELTGPYPPTEPPEPSSIPDVNIPGFGNLRRFAPGEDNGASFEEAIGAGGLALGNKMSADIVPSVRDAMSGPIGMGKAFLSLNPSTRAMEPAIDAARSGLGFLANHGVPVPELFLNRSVDPESDEGREQARETPESAAADIAPAAYGQGQGIGDAINIAMAVPGLIDAAPTIRAGLADAAGQIKSGVSNAASAVKSAATSQPVRNAAATVIEKAPHAAGAAIGGYVGGPAGAGVGAMAGKGALGKRFSAVADELRFGKPSGPSLPTSPLAEDIGAQGSVSSGLELDEINGGRIARQLAELKQRMGMGVDAGDSFASAAEDISPDAVADQLRFGATPQDIASASGADVDEIAKIAKQQRTQGGPSGPPHVTPKTSPTDSLQFGSPVPEVTGQVNMPQPSPTRAPPAGLDFDVSGYPQGATPEQFPQGPTAAPEGFSLGADELRAGLRLPGHEPNPLGPRLGANPTGYDAESLAIEQPQPAGNLDLSVADRPAAKARQAAAAAAPAPAPEPMPVPRPASAGPLTEVVPGVKMPARFDPKKMQALYDSLPPDQRDAALAALAQAHGSAPWQAGGLGASGGKGVPFKAEARAAGTFLPTSMEGAHTGRQEMSGAPWRENNPVMAAAVEAQRIGKATSAAPQDLARAIMSLPQAQRGAAMASVEGTQGPLYAAQVREAVGAMLRQVHEVPGGPGMMPTPDELRLMYPNPPEARMQRIPAEEVNLPAPSAPSAVDEDLPSFVRKATPGSGGDLKSRTWKAREEGEAIDPGYIRKQSAAEAKADALPKDRGELLDQILEANGIKDHDSARADAAYRKWKAGGRKGPKPKGNLGGMLDAFDAVKDKPGSVSSLLEAFEKQTAKAKTYRDIKPALDALAEALGVDSLRLPDEVVARHIEQDAARSSR